MFDLHRLRGVLSAFGLIVAMVGVNVLPFRAAMARHGEWMPESGGIGLALNYPRVGGLISGVASERRASRGGFSSEKFGVVIGSSSVESSIDCVDLARLESGPATRWLLVKGSGTNLGDSEQLMKMFDQSTLRVDRVVIGFNLFMIASAAKYDADSEPVPWPEFSTHLRTRQASLLLRDLNQEGKSFLALLFPRRNRINSDFPVVLAQAKLRFFAAMSVGPEVLFPPDANPWNKEPWRTAENRPPASLRHKAYEAWKDRGWFEASSYEPDGPNVQALIRLIVHLQARQTQVVLVILPVESELRRLTPPEALSSLKTALDRSFGRSSPPLLDFQDAIPDDRFWDFVHLDPRYQHEFTAQLAKSLPPP